MRGFPAVLLLFLAGCADSSHNPDPIVEPGEDVPPMDEAQIVVDMVWNFTNRQPWLISEDVDIAGFNVVTGWDEITVTVELLQSPPVAFASNVRLISPNGTMQQAAFAQGFVELEEKQPELGHWRLTYATDEIVPEGRHSLDVEVILSGPA